MVHFYIRSVIKLFLLLFLSGIFTASAFGSDEENSTNALEVYGQVHVEGISQGKNDQGDASEEEEVTTGKWKVAEPLTLDQKIFLAEQEYQRQREKMLCKLCKVNELGRVYLPCGHVRVCSECEDEERLCGNCSKYIQALATIKLS